MNIKAYAKVNLTLDVVGKREGMHLLDSVTSTIDLYDDVEVVFRDDDMVVCFMDGVLQGEDNSAYRAARLMVGFYKLCGADIRITKRIPFSAGLGGSTADGVAVLKAYAEEFDFLPADEVIVGLGSDYPCMLKGGFCRIRGMGEVVSQISLPCNYDMVIAVADGGVSTAGCYAFFDCMQLTNQEFTPRLLTAEKDYYSYFGNALTLPAKMLNGNIGSAFEAVNSLKPLAAVLTGSGSAVVGYFPEGSITEQLLQGCAFENCTMLPRVFKFI